VAAEIRALGRKALAIPADATAPENVERIVAAAQADFGRIDILVNNVGGAPSRRLFYQTPVWELPEDFWGEIIAANLTSAFLWTKAVMSHFIAQGSGEIINIASAVGKTLSADSNVYSIAKSALLGFTQIVAQQAKVHGIRVNAISPGLTDTPGLRRIAEKLSIPEDQWPPSASAESVAAGVVYLLCDAPELMTGQSLDLWGT